MSLFQTENAAIIMLEVSKSKLSIIKTQKFFSLNGKPSFAMKVDVIALILLPKLIKALIC